MASVSTYLNFNRNTEEAFNFYKSVFGGDFFGDGPMRFGDFPPQEGQPPLSDEDKNLIMHVELRIFNNHSLMGTDAPNSMGFNLNFGNNSYINLQPDTRAETDRLFAALSKNGQITSQLEEMFWGDYFGHCIDQFGVQWMFNCGEPR